MDTKNRLQLIELISLGKRNITIVEPVDVFAFALQKQAAKFILVHNHPSGDIKPSSYDIEATDRMQAVGRFVKVPMLDHLIISEKKYFSFKDSGMLTKIIKKSSYDLSFKKIDKLLSTNQNLRVNSLKEKLEMENEKTRLEKEMAERTIETAKQMALHGIDIDKISLITGISIDQVKQMQKG